MNLLSFAKCVVLLLIPVIVNYLLSFWSLNVVLVLYHEADFLIPTTDHKVNKM